jgi:transmembrane sensor
MRTNSRTTRQPDPALARAVEWMVLLRSGQAGSREVAAFETWRTQDPAHGAACERMDGAFGTLARLRERGVPAALAQRSLQGLSRRSVLRATLGLAGLGSGASLLGWQVADSQGLLADQHTGLAQRRQETLSDGSLVWLDARTVVDVAMETSQRTLALYRGRLLVQASAATVPLQVHTPQARIHANDARFIVQARQDQGLQVTALRGTVALALPTGDRLDLAEGHRVALADHRAPELVAARGTESLWTRGFIAMDNEPLAQLIDALRDYHLGVLDLNADVAGLHVSGMFSLDAPDRTLQALAETRPVRVRTMTRYWVSIEAAG